MEFRENIKAVHTGRKYPPEFGAASSLRQKGKTVSEETRAKISSSLKGHVQTAEQRAKNSAAQMGNKRGLGVIKSPETLEKISIASKDSWAKRKQIAALENIPITNYKHSLTTRARMSAGQRAQWAERKAHENST